MDIKFFKHQIDALDFISQKKQSGIFYDMGLGKTLIVLEHIKRTGVFPILIVSPLSVVPVWQDQSNYFEYGFKFSELVGTKLQRIKKLDEPSDIYAVNYEGLRVMENHLLKKKFKMIILDESHRIKERTSQQTLIAMKLSYDIEYRYILTGTPVTKSPEDIWTQMHFLQPNFLGNFYAFQNKYIQTRKITVRTNGGMKEIHKAYRFKNLKELQEKLGLITIRKTKAECLDLPEKVYQKIYASFTPEQRKAYVALRHNLKMTIDSQSLNATNAAAITQKLQQVCQGFIYDENKAPIYFENHGKIKSLLEINDSLSDKKIIVFTWFVADILQVKQALVKAGREVLVYDGSSDDRRNIVNEFQSFDKPLVFLSNIEKAKEGITLTAANYVIYYGNSYNYGSRAQSEDRAHRAGQKNNVTYYDIVVPNTIDERVTEILLNKKKIADAVTGDPVRLAKLEAESEL